MIPMVMADLNNGINRFDGLIVSIENLGHTAPPGPDAAPGSDEIILTEKIRLNGHAVKPEAVFLRINTFQIYFHVTYYEHRNLFVNNICGVMN